MKRSLKYSLVIGSLIPILGYLCFHWNIAGLQDWCYGSRYFRPYAQLKQQQRDMQVVQLRDGKIFLPNWQQSEIFDPVTKTSEMVPGWDSINVSCEEPNFLVLNNGNVLVMQGHDNSLSSIRCKGPYELSGNAPQYCPIGKTPLFNAKLKKFQWIDFPLTNLQGHTAVSLKNGNLIIAGGVLHTENTPRYDSYKGKSYFENNIR